MDDITNSIAITLHPETMAYIQQLVETLLYGDTAETVVIALIDEGIRKAIKDGFIKVRTQ